MWASSSPALIRFSAAPPTPATRAALPPLAPASTTTVSPSCCLRRSTASRSALASKPSSRAARTLMPPTSTAPDARSAVAPLAALAFNDSSSRSSLFCFSSSARSLSAASAVVPPSSCAASPNRRSSAATWSSAPCPVTASIRRTPAETPPSDTILNRPMSPVRETWVPPHSSVDVSPMRSTRTRSTYFSPNRAIAPKSSASCMSMCRTSAPWLARNSAFPRRSTPASPPPGAGRDAALGHDLEQADVAGARDVGAAAQLGGRIAHAQHAHALAVLLAEQGHRAEVQRLLHVHVPHLGTVVGADLGVDPALDLGQLRSRHRLEVREVEAQAVGSDQRAFLGDVRAQHLAQRRVQQVRGAVVEDGRAAACAVDRGDEVVADLQRAGCELAHVAVELAGVLLGIGHGEAHALLVQLAGIAALARSEGH